VITQMNIERLQASHSGVFKFDLQIESKVIRQTADNVNNPESIWD